MTPLCIDKGSDHFPIVSKLKLDECTHAAAQSAASRSPDCTSLPMTGVFNEEDVEREVALGVF